MHRNRSAARVLAWGFGLALAFRAPHSRAADPPGLDPADARLRQVVEARVVFPCYVFGGETFPRCEFENPERMRGLIGPYRIGAKFYDRCDRPVDVPIAAGPYHAVIEVEPETGRKIRRGVTLFKTSVLLPADWRDEGDAAPPLLELLGDAAVMPYGPMLKEQLRGRTFGEFSRDPAVARWLAGMSSLKVGDRPLRNAQDAVSLDRQWWVDHERGLGRAPVTPFFGPRPIEGKPATVLHVGTPSEAGFKPGSVEKIDAICRQWAADSDEAFAVCVARHGVVVLHKGYGTRDGLPMTVDTPSWMASVTKTMSAGLMMMLVDRGLVDLDAPLDTYLPALRGIEVETPLTVRHLYTHTGGLDRWPGWPDEWPDVEERVARYYDRLQVGKVWAYQGAGYTLGGKVIERLTGEAVPLFFRNHLLDPLGCANTTVYGTHADAGSVPLDMAKFAQMLLNGGAYGDRRFFSEATFTRMLPVTLTKVLGPGTDKVFGIGLDGQPSSFGHGAASSAVFRVDRVNDLVVIVTRNTAGKNWEKYQGRFSDAVQAGLEPASTGPAKGALVVGGGDDVPEIRARFVELAGGPDARFVFIPTASETDDNIPRSAELWKARFGVKNVTLLHTRDRAEADSESFVAPLREAKGVWFGGGRQWRLVDSYLGTRTQRALEEVLERGGVLGGSSAGATIQGSYLVRGAREGNHVMMAPGYEQGFGYLKNVAVDQHLRTRRRENDLVPVIESHPALLGIGLDDTAAIVVHGGRFEVIGRGRVAVYDGKDHGGKRYEFLSVGDRFDLHGRTPVGK